MSQEEMRSWELWGITQDDWEAGWRRTLEHAVEAAFAGAEIDDENTVEIIVRKRSDNSVHDYRVGK
jgi:hypothetical protein